MNLEILCRPFPPEMIKQRPGLYGDMIDYVEAHNVIARLNEAFGGEWTFRILDHKILDDEVVVLAELVVDEVVKQQFGSSTIVRREGEDRILSLGDALKAAASDALKKTATLFGVGLYLYKEYAEERGGDFEATTKEETPAASATPITTDQIEEILTLAKQRNITQTQVENRLRELYGVRKLDQLTQGQANEVLARLRPAQQ